MPSVPHVNTCCFFFSTEVGSKIIALFLLITGIIESISSILYLISTITNKHQQGFGDAVIQVCLSLILTLMALYLTLGVFKRNMRYVKNWLFVAAVYIVLVIIGIIIELIRGDPAILGQIVNILIMIYCVIVVHSFYEDNFNTQPATY